jgi:FAD/FMN-containing dehydrogenase
MKGTAMYVSTNNGHPSTGSAEMSPDDLAQLAEKLHGRLLLPGGGGYDVARGVFNAMIDRHPATIIRCADTHDVIEGVVFARTHGLDIAIKGGGHSVSGNAVCDGGLMLDLSGMKHRLVDPTKLIATVQPGLTLGEFDRETQLFGLATPTGVVSMTGLAGLALGGGLGWLNGKHGLTCDNLLAAEVVTASGERITASPDEHEDLLWGLRGGGGNFGVVTSFTFRLYPMPGVVAGAVTYPAARARDALRLYHEFASGCPDELTANASVALDAEGG